MLLFRHYSNTGTFRVNNCYRAWIGLLNALALPWRHLYVATCEIHWALTSGTAIWLTSQLLDHYMVSCTFLLEPLLLCLQNYCKPSSCEYSKHCHLVILRKGREHQTKGTPSATKGMVPLERDLSRTLVCICERDWARLVCPTGSVIGNIRTGIC